MASWLTHLRVAEKIKQKIPEIDFPYFLIGSIAPDSGVSDEKQRNYTPSKEITHYRYQKDDSISDMDDSVFFDSYLKPEKIMTRSDSTRSFLWGYYFHLITDKLWLEEYFMPLKIQYENESDKGDKDFVDFIREEMVSLDFEYLELEGMELINQLKDFNGNISFFSEFDSDYIYECKDRIADFYSGEPINLNKEYKYLTPQKIEDFVVKAAEKCISILII
ncbi:MAG: hypothetical protein PHI04_02920 [Clostridiaceae bacterium]|nr:hypothetical protein [Clostridiaceae bacterium]HNR05023.1 hypothetical protein [Bacillota bacterium]